MKAKKVSPYATSFKKLPLKPVGYIVLGVLIGGIVGYFASQTDNHDARYELASQSEIKSAKAAISAKFKATECGDTTDAATISGRQEVFDQYLKVNSYANRAVIRGCDDADSLLAKDPISGEWQLTNINVSLDRRTNPAWQAECLITDITTADDAVRPENTSIDAYNLVGCRKLQEREQIVDILSKSGAIERSKITEQDVDAYIDGGEAFYKSL